MKKLIQASFFWKNNEPGGLGFTLASPDFSPFELATMFTGDIVKQYMRDSDKALGTSVVNDYLDQLAAIAIATKNKPATMQQVLLAALNIMWLAERGFIPNDEFNGPQFVWADTP